MRGDRVEGRARTGSVGKIAPPPAPVVRYRTGDEKLVYCEVCELDSTQRDVRLHGGTCPDCGGVVRTARRCRAWTVGTPSHRCSLTLGHDVDPRSKHVAYVEWEA